MRTRHALRTYVSFLSPVRCFVASRCPVRSFLGLSTCPFRAREICCAASARNCFLCDTLRDRNSVDRRSFDVSVVSLPNSRRMRPVTNFKKTDPTSVVVHLEFTMLVIYRYQYQWATYSVQFSSLLCVSSILEFRIKLRRYLIGRLGWFLGMLVSRWCPSKTGWAVKSKAR